MSHGLSTNLAGLDGITNESYCKQLKVLVLFGMGIHSSRRSFPLTRRTLMGKRRSGCQQLGWGRSSARFAAISL